MTPFEIERLDFAKPAVNGWTALDPRHRNWPVVYVIDSDELNDRADALRNVYVGETLNAAGRMRQHLESPDKQQLSRVRVILDDTFNKSVCLDLESHLIRWLAGDGAYRVLNRNDGIIEADYYERTKYRKSFRDIFDELRADGVFTRSIPEIENSDLFKLSPYKALSTDQAVAVENLVESLLEDLEADVPSMSVIEGAPGTGKTVIAIYLIKLLVDIANSAEEDIIDSDTMFAEFFVEENRETLADLRIGLVVPQQSLRDSIRRVFRKTPGLTAAMVLSPFDVGKSDEVWDILVVDEAHRLNQRANQPSGFQNGQFAEITTKLFGQDDLSKTQLDWVRAKSAHQLLLIDGAQSVRPADLPSETIDRVVEAARRENRLFPLVSQMRVRADEDYVSYVRQFLTVERPLPSPMAFVDYDFRMFDDLGSMHDAILRREAEVGLSRLVAGYAWPWRSRKDSSAFDIELDGRQLRWNSTDKNWIASRNSVNEVGSIHTVQGYDLNYAGVIMGPDLRYTDERGIHIDRASYFDTKGKENNPKLGLVYTDDDLRRYITNIYAVLLTRGILGTYVYVVDAQLREYLRRYIPA